jgi:hypothetical protein
MKPLGLDQNKARAALNNLKNGSVTPKNSSRSNNAIHHATAPPIIEEEYK